MRSALSPNTDGWNFGAQKAVSEATQVRKLKCSKWGSGGLPLLHIKKGAKDDFAKAEVGFVGWWLVWPSTGLFQFLVHLPQ